MPNRFQRAQHEIAYGFIAARDGEYCLICKGEGKLKKPPEVKLQIDHADDNPKNWDPGNLHLLCQKHNLEMRKLTSAEHKKFKTWSQHLHTITIQGLRMMMFADKDQ